MGNAHSGLTWGLSAIALAAVGCELVAGIRDVSPLPAAGSGGGSTVAGPASVGAGGSGAASSTSSTSSTSTTSTTTSSTSTTSGAGGVSCDFMEDPADLIVRYEFQDKTGTTAKDSAPDPLPLTVDLDMVGKGLNWTPNGLAWQGVNQRSAHAGYAPKISKGFSGNGLTLEFVLRIDSVPDDAGLVTIGDSMNKIKLAFAVFAQPPGMGLIVDALPYNAWDMPTLGKIHVLHYVQGVPLYVDGVKQAEKMMIKGGMNPPGATDTMYVGNLVPTASGAPQGEIDYFAAYGSLFDETRVKKHAAILGHPECQ